MGQHGLMTPLGLFLWGVALVLIDLGSGGPDLVLDVFGWLICALALNRLAPRSGWFQMAIWGAIAGAALTVGQIAGLPSNGAITAATTAAEVCVVWGVCTGIVELMRDNPSLESPFVEARFGTVANRVRWVQAIAGAALALMLGASAVTGRGVGQELFVPLVVYLMSGIGFLYLLLRLRRHPELQTMSPS